MRETGAAGQEKNLILQKKGELGEGLSKHYLSEIREETGSEGESRNKKHDTI